MTGPSAVTGKHLAATISVMLPEVMTGSLSVFGDIFGGRVDNVHRIVDAHGREDLLLIEFDGGETLRVWHPAGLTVGSSAFRIERASRVRWEWFYYGRPHLPQNRYYIEHTRTGRKVRVVTDAAWGSRRFSPSPSRPAVELLGW